MKTFITILAAVFALNGLIDNIATINRLKKEAEEAFKAENYERAIEHYSLLVDSLNVEDENIKANLAHAYLMAEDTTSAQQNYTQLIKSENHDIKSLAFQQLGVIQTDQQKFKEALSMFKESLKANPANEEARYNYEIVKKLMEQQQEQQQDQQNQDQQNKDQQQQDKEQQQQDQQSQDQENQQGEDQQQKDQEGEESEQGKDQEQKDQQGEQDGEQKDQEQQQEGEEQQDGEKKEGEQPMPSVSDKLKEMNISEEKAKMILDAMRNSEMQYIQQNRRKAAQPKDRTKPDW